MKRTYILALGLFIFVLLLGTIAVLNILQSKTQNSQSNVLPTPTPVAYFLPKRNAVPSIPPVFKQKETQKMLQSLQDRQPLATADAITKVKLINSLSPNQEIIFSNNEFAVYYIRPLDLFQVEIKILDITKAKKDAVLWFLSQGMTNNGVCKLPVTFYVDYPILQVIKQEGIQFSPIPDGC